MARKRKGRESAIFSLIGGDGGGVKATTAKAKHEEDTLEEDGGGGRGTREETGAAAGIISRVSCVKIPHDHQSLLLSP